MGVFQIEPASGALKFIGNTEVDATPRAFHFDPSGRFCYCAGEQTDTIKCFAFDAATGAMDLMETYSTGRHPWWVEIVELGEPSSL